MEVYALKLLSEAMWNTVGGSTQRKSCLWELSVPTSSYEMDCFLVMADM